MFILSLTVAYIPTALTNFFITKAKYITYSGYINSFSEKSSNHIHHFYNKQFRDEKEAYFTHESWLIIQEDYDFIVDMSSLIFNVVLNVMVLSWFLNSAFLISYLCAVPLAILCVTLSKSNLQYWSDKSQTSRSEMMQTLGSGWDTILTGNTWNIGIWKNYFAKKAAASGKNQRGLILNIDIIATLTLMISAFPILIVLFMTFQNALGDIQLLAMLVATTPRQVTTIQYLSDAISLFVNLNDKARRTKQLSAHLNFDKENVNKGQIKWGAIFISSKNYDATPVYSFDEIVTGTNGFKPGRYTITGSNGTGKTTLLADIKTKLHGNAYILPTHSKIIFLNDTGLGEFSSGEKMAANLHEIADNVCATEMPVILLDEWNANLDNENIKKLSKIIDDISINNCVIEVIHNYEKRSMDVVTH
jgi:ABC-type bacteriocin/lantibiotic exporter with double-glycine peptidase domain